MPPPVSKHLNFRRRLHYSWQYRRFFGGSEVFRLSQCTVFRIRNDLGHFRLGITLKARGSSVERNQAKRRIRETFRKMAELAEDYDYNVVISKAKRLDYPFARRLAQCLRNELPFHLKRKPPR